MALAGPPRLAGAGQVWLPGADYDVVDAMPLPATHADAQPCPAFRIRRHGTLYVLVVVPGLPAGVPPRRAGWQILPLLPPHPSVIPVLHQYTCVHPTLAPAHGALFLVLPPQGLSVTEYIAQRRASIPLPPYGLGWRWFAEVLLSVLLAVDHLATHHVVHGHICWDNFQLEPELEALGHPYLTGFHDAWFMAVDGQPIRADLRRKRVGGTGSYRAPDVYRAVPAALEGADTVGLLDKAETWTAGRCMYDLLCGPAETQFFHRVRALPGYRYDDRQLPPLPATCPEWLTYVVQALVRSEARDRLSARDAIQMLRLSLQHPPRDIVTVVEKIVQQPVLATGDPLPDAPTSPLPLPTTATESPRFLSPPRAAKPLQTIGLQVPYNPLDLEAQDRSWGAEAAAPPPTSSDSPRSFNTNSSSSASPGAGPSELEQEGRAAEELRLAGAWGLPPEAFASSGHRAGPLPKNRYTPQVTKSRSPQATARARSPTSAGKKGKPKP